MAILAKLVWRLASMTDATEASALDQTAPAL
jgi:hypothetical protein